MICEKCGKENKDTAHFCSECGTALIDKPIELDLQQIKVPAASRKPRIIKVSTKKSDEMPESEEQIPVQDIDDIILPKADEEIEEKRVADVKFEKVDEDEEFTEDVSDETEPDDEAETLESEADEFEPEQIDDTEDEKDEKTSEFAPDFDEIEDVKPLEESVPAEPNSDAKSEENAMSVGAWIGTFILTCIPVLGFIMLLVWAISKKTKKSKRTFAIAVLILTAISAVLSAVAYFLIYNFS